MPTRRNLLLGVGNLAIGGGIVTRGALNALAEPTADMRVISDVRCPTPDLRLKPGRDDEAYVSTNANGDVEELLLNGLGVAGEGLNRTAETRFEQIVRVCNEGGPAIEELSFEFEVVDEGLTVSDPTPANIEEALFIASAGGDVAGDGSSDFIAATDHGQLGNGQIDAGEELSFGIGVDLLPSSSIQDLPDPTKFTVKLHIVAQSVDQPECDVDTGPDISGVQWKGGQINPIESPEDTSITVDLWYFDETTGGSASGGGPPGQGNGSSSQPIDDFEVACGVSAETNKPLQSFVSGQPSNSHVAVYIHEADESWYHPDFDPAAGETTDWTENTDGIRWGDGSIEGSFDVGCQ